MDSTNISNTVGTMSFTGGTTKGISGTPLNILSMTFKATGAGTSTISFSDGAITASDGLGTNVLTTINRATINVSGVGLAPAVEVVTAPVIPPTIPQIVERPRVPTGKLPIAPTIEVNTYPDEAHWYNKIGEVSVFWDVPKDVTAVAASIDKNPNGVPPKFESQLFDGKIFNSLTEGAWYAHVRFKNNIGNGPVVTHKISIDITPPISFNVSSSRFAKSSSASEKRASELP